MSVEEILSGYAPEKENLLQILYDIQSADETNHVSSEAIKEVASWLKIPVSSVYGVLKYYSMYGTNPRAHHIIRVCNSVVCAMHNSADIKAELDTLSKGLSDSGENVIHVEFTECLGHCEQAPVIMIDDDMVGNLSHENSEEIVNLIKKS